MASDATRPALRRDRHRRRPQRARHRGVPRHGPACGRSSSSARDRVGGAAGTARARARRPRPDARPHGRAAAAVGRPRPRPQARTGCRSSRPDVRVFAPRPGRPRDHAVGRRRRGPPTALRARSAADADALRRRSTGSSARWPASSASSPARTPPDIKSPGLGDALAGPAARADVPRPRASDDGRTILRVLPMAVADFVAESFETDALRAAIAWRGVQYTAMGPWSAGTTAVLLADSAGNDGGAAGQTVFARGGPGALSRRARGRGARRPASRSGPAPRSSRSPSRDGRATGVVARVAARRSTARGRRRRHRPEADPDRPRRPGRGRPEPALAGRQHPDAGHGRQGQPRARGLPRVPARPATTRALLRGRILIAPGDRRHGAGPRRGQVRPAVATRRSSRRRSRRSSTRRSSTGAAPGHARHERHRPVRRRTRLRDGDVGRRPREALGDLVVADARDGYAPGSGRRSVTARAGPDPARPRARLRPDRRPPAARRAGLDQFFLWRPLLGHARYRLPVSRALPRGLRRAPGRRHHRRTGQNAAREIVADLQAPALGLRLGGAATCRRGSSRYRRSTRPRQELGRRATRWPPPPRDPTGCCRCRSRRRRRPQGPSRRA